VREAACRVLRNAVELDERMIMSTWWISRTSGETHRVDLIMQKRLGAPFPTFADGSRD